MYIIVDAVCKPQAFRGALIRERLGCCELQDVGLNAVLNYSADGKSESYQVPSKYSLRIQRVGPV